MDSEVRLNATALISPDSFYIYLHTPAFRNLRSLIDSGSSHCFIDSSFVSRHDIKTNSVTPIRLKLFDGTSNNYITESALIPVTFPSGETFSLTFYVTPLDSSCSLVLGYNWLRHYNPLIDWTTNQISFRSTDHRGLVPPSTSPGEASVLPEPISIPTPVLPQSVPISDPDPILIPDPDPIPSVSDPKVTPSDSDLPHISFINAVAYSRACKAKGSQKFTLHLTEEGLFGKSSTAEPVDDLNGVPDEYHEFADVFSKGKSFNLPPHRPYDLKIDLEDGIPPPPGRMYSLSPKELEELQKFLQENVRAGFVRPSKSPHGAPILFIKKKDGSLRLCVDFRGINRLTKKDHYPLPLISDLLDAPGQACVYTKIDLRHAYHLVRIAEGDEWKTTFRTRYGSFEWLVVPEGLTNAPSTFQRFMNDIFSDMLDVTVIVYLDDILIYSDDMTHHRQHVREFLKRLRKHGLFANGKKCQFHKDTVEYLGYILSPVGLTMSEEKVKTIIDWPEPRKIKDVQSFLGFANFYRRFIHGYSDIVIPLTRLTRKDTSWNFDTNCRKAFDKLKEEFTHAPVLAHWKPDSELIIETDASDYALAAILSQRTSDGEIHPIAFHSRSFHSSELNYDTHDKELLAIFEAFKRWRQYLEGSGTPIDVVTDHKNLEYFSTTKLLTRRQARWSEYLSGFNFVIRFRPGKLGTKPDALTRRWDVYRKEGNSDFASVNPSNYRPIFTQEQLTSLLRATFLVTPILRHSVTLDINSIHNDIRSSYTLDPVSAEKIQLLTDPVWRTDSDGFLLQNNRIYVPDAKDLRLRILQYKHDHVLSGHFGQNKTLQLVRREYVWPNLRTFVNDFCNSCTSCKRSKAPRHKPYGLLKQLPVPERPWNSISMDFIEHLPDSAGFTSILVIVDRLSKQGIFIPTVDEINSHELARLFVINVFSKHGVPSHVTCDRGSEFVSHFFRSLGEALDMKIHFTSGYHPEGDGQTERLNQTLEQYLRVLCNYQQDNWSELLPLSEFAYNNAPSATTGVSPFFANKGYHPNITVHPERELASQKAREFVVDLDELHSELRNQMSLAQQRYQGPADKRRIPAPDFKVGQQVFVRAENIHTTRPSKKLSEKYLGPFEIIAQPGTHSFTLRLPEHMRAIHPVFHVSQLEPSIPNSIPNRTQPPPPPVVIDDELEYEIAEVLDSKIDNRRRCKLLYLVKWSGYEGTDEENSWLPATELEHAQEIVDTFHSRYPQKPGPLPL